MSNKSVKHVIRGKAMFAKILGDPVLNYSKDGKEWKLDVIIDDATVKELKGLGIADRVKRKETYLEGQPHLTFKQGELRKDGSPNDPIKVTDILDDPWDQNKLIGNLSDIDVSFVVVDYGPGKKHGVYIRSVRVLKLVEYNKKEFESVKADDPFFAEAAMLAEKKAKEIQEFRKDFSLDDGLDDIGLSDEEVV